MIRQGKGIQLWKVEGIRAAPMDPQVPSAGHGRTQEIPLPVINKSGSFRLDPESISRRHNAPCEVRDRIILRWLLSSLRTPFLLGGAFQGAAAGALAMGLLLGAHRLLEHQVEGVYFFAAGQIVGFIFLSTLLGGLGSGAALRRHLRL